MKTLTHQEACEKLSQWLCVPIDVCLDKLSEYQFTEWRGAIAYQRGPELHVTAPPEVQGKWLGKDFIREIMGPIIKEYGYIKTTVPDGYPLGLRFVKRMGFVNVGGVNWELRC